MIVIVYSVYTYSYGSMLVSFKVHIFLSRSFNDRCSFHVFSIAGTIIFVFLFATFSTFIRFERITFTLYCAYVHVISQMRTRMHYPSYMLFFTILLMAFVRDSEYSFLGSLDCCCLDCFVLVCR